MYHLPRGASAQDAQAASGLSFISWNRFRNITKAEADACVNEHPDTPWRSYTAPEQQAITDKINARLAAEKIGPVGEDIIAWKMHTLIRDVLKAKDRLKKKEQQTIESSPAELPNQSSHYTAFFDPVRNV